MRGLVSEDEKYVQVNEFMSIEKKTQIEEFLKNRQETHSTITRTSDSGVGSWSRASTEWGSEEGAGGNIRCLMYGYFFFLFPHLKAGFADTAGT